MYIMIPKMQDVKECAKVYVEAYQGEPWNEVYEISEAEIYISNYLNSDTKRCFALVENDEIKGVALGFIVPSIEGDYLRIEDFCVDAHVQRKGYGSSFMTLLQQEAMKLGCDSILLGTQKDYPSHQFYLKNGFQEIESVLLYKEVEKTGVMLELYSPKLEDLWFRQMFMADEETMSYNHHWGGTIPFPKENWADWYDDWVVNPKGNRFYRYLKEKSGGNFVGEIAYHYDEEENKYIADIIVYAKYRGKGFGEQGLLLLCEAAKANGVEILYDNIAIDNPAINLFLKTGFYEEYRTDEIIMLKKEL